MITLQDLNDMWPDYKHVNLQPHTPHKDKYLPSEADPNGKAQHEPGAKLDAGKSPIYRGLVDYFPRAIEAVARISAIGAKKYAWKGWESVPEGIPRYSDALMRHLARESYEYRDTDTGEPHAAQVAWNSLARLELLLREQEGKNNV